MHKPDFHTDLSQEVFERIESYLLDQMEDAEKATFEAEMAKDQTLAEQTEGLRSLILSSEIYGLQESMNKFHADLEEGEGKVKKLNAPFPLQRYLIAAAIGLLILIGIFSLPKGGDQNEQLFAAYFQADPGLITSMSAGNNYAFNKAMVAYKEGKYKEAIGSWEKLYQNNPQNDSLNYFLGAAYLANAEPTKAIAYFEYVYPLEESSFQQESLWYLGLAYLKAGEVEKAKEFLAKSTRPEKDKLLEQLSP